MEKKPRRTGMCQISKREYPLNELMPASFVREPILNFIQDEYPDWDPEGYIAITELNKFRYIYIEKLLEAEKGRLTKFEEELKMIEKDLKMQPRESVKVMDKTTGVKAKKPKKIEEDIGKRR